MPPQKKLWPIVLLRLDDTRHVRLIFVLLSDPRAEISTTSAVPYCPTPLSFIQGDGTTNEDERGGNERESRRRGKNHAEDVSFGMPAPGVRERLRISFNSAQRLTRAASESPPPPSVVVGGWDTTLRAVGLGGGDGTSRRFAPLWCLWGVRG
jgi:hypothetical protein